MPQRTSADERQCIYVSIAAANFDATVFDTNDLSTIRGSSLTLLEAPDVAFDALRRQYEQTGSAKVEKITDAASELLARITPVVAAAPAEKPPAKLHGESKQKYKKRLESLGFGGSRSPAAPDLSSFAKEIEATCRDSLTVDSNGWPLSLFTFAVATHQPGSNGSKAKPDLETFRALESGIGVDQHTRPTVPIPAEPAEGVRPAGKAYCVVTGTLPATTDRSEGALSDSVVRRKKVGREQKTGFYKKVLDRGLKLAEPTSEEFKAIETALQALDAPSIGFAASFHDIVADPLQHLGRKADVLPPNVRNKLAVVYFDGNNFGKKRSDLLNSNDGMERLTTFSDRLAVRRCVFLARCLSWMLNEPGMTNNKAAGDDGEDADAGVGEEAKAADKRLRFETLLWGGDEMAFVLPAWYAWDFMGVCQNALAGWFLPEMPAKPFTHAAGMVFAHYKTPIRELRKAADDLAGAAKDKAKDPPLEANDVQVMALEGLDHAELSIIDLRAGFFRPGGVDGGGNAPSAAAFSLKGEQWGDLRDAIHRLRDGSAGISQLHHFYRRAVNEKLLRTSGETVDAFVTGMVDKLRKSGADDDELEALTGNRLRRDAKDHPLIPLFQFLMLHDYAAPPPKDGEDDT